MILRCRKEVIALDVEEDYWRMKGKNIAAEYLGFICATVVSMIYFLQIVKLSNSGKADKNVIFYIGGCILFYIVYLITEKIFAMQTNLNEKNFQWITAVTIAAVFIWILRAYDRCPKFEENPTHDVPIVLHFTLLAGMMSISGAVLDFDRWGG